MNPKYNENTASPIRLVPGYDEKETVLPMLKAYTDALIEGEPGMEGYLAKQNYDEEVKDLRKKYGPPEGRFYLALWDGEPCGCIALRPMPEGEEGDCELKRLYVDPAYRGRGIARRLTEQLIMDARAIGYRRILLDTLPFLTAAIDLYHSVGFHDIEKYNDSPMTDAVYMAYLL